MAQIPNSTALGQPEVGIGRAPAQFNQVRVDTQTATDGGGRQLEQIGSALGNASRAVGEFGAAVEKHANEADDYEAKKRFVQFDLDQEKRLDDARHNYDVPEAKDFTKSYMNDYHAGARELFASLPDSQKAKYDYLLVQRGAQYEKKAYDHELVERDRFHREDIDLTTQNLRNETIAKPESYKDNLARGISLIDSSRLSIEEKHKTKKAFAQSVEEDAIRGRISRGDDFEAIAKDVERVPKGGGYVKTNATGLRTDESGLELIRQNEGFTGIAQPDTSKGHSVGYGTFGVKPGSRMTREEAETAMRREVGEVEAAMADKIKVPLTQGQHNALVDLFYNVSRDKNDRLDTVADLINTGKADQVPGFIMQFKRDADGRPLRALEARRRKEVALWNEDGPIVGLVPDKVRVSQLGPIGAPDSVAPQGLVEPGNIDLGNRPQVKNPDGSISTVRSISIDEDGKQVLLPTVSGDGTILSDKEAADLYKKTGKHLGKFENVFDANAFAKDLHEQQSQLVDADITDAPYKYLRPEQRRTLAHLAREAARSTILDDVTNDVEQIRRTGQASPGKDGKLSLDRAKGILTDRQYTKVKDAWKEADLEHQTIAPLANMSEDDALHHIGSMLPDDGDSDYAIKVKVAKKASDKLDAALKLRKKDPALAVNSSPEVREAFDLIARSRTAVNAVDGGTVDAAGLLPPAKAHETLIEARIAAQRRLGLSDSEISPITRKQAVELLLMPDPKLMNESDLPKKLKEARDRAEAMYGPKYSKLVFESAVKTIATNQKVRDVAAPIISRMINGEPVTEADYAASDALNRASYADALFAPQYASDVGRGSMMTPLQTDVFKRQSPDEPGGWFGGSKPTRDGAFNTAKPASASKPPPEAIDYLKKNPSIFSQFDAKYGPGSAAAALKR